ncbi:S-Ena type endospore appendage [Pontibacillus sp. HMF3514]|uniref:S-Ena type endospore appendage n=1 Tax=Pontibacillus sp. HMF3514 TaxID=2692425 RepID=UPI00351BD38F
MLLTKKGGILLNTCDSKLSLKNRSIETDIFEQCYTYPCDTTNTLWKKSNNTKNVCGSFSISIIEACGPIQIFVNGPFVRSLVPDKQTTLLYTISDLESIHIRCVDENNSGGSCKVNLRLQVNYECC